MSVLPSGQVSFQWKNPDFLFKNPDFPLKSDDFIIKQGLAIKMGSRGEVCLVAGSSTAPPSSLAASMKVVTDAEASVEAATSAEYPRAKVGSARDSVDAIRAVMGWNTMYDHRATVITPVSRSIFDGRILISYFEES